MDPETDRAIEKKKVRALWLPRNPTACRSGRPQDFVGCRSNIRKSKGTAADGYRRRPCPCADLRRLFGLRRQKPAACVQAGNCCREAAGIIWASRHTSAHKAARAGSLIFRPQQQWRRRPGGRWSSRSWQWRPYGDRRRWTACSSPGTPTPCAGSHGEPLRR